MLSLPRVWLRGFAEHLGAWRHSHTTNVDVVAATVALVSLSLCSCRCSCRCSCCCSCRSWCVLTLVPTLLRVCNRRTQQSLRDMPRRVRKPLKHTTSAAAADRKQSSAGNRLQGNTNKPAPAAPVAGAGGGAGARATPRNPLPPTNTNTNNKAAAGTPQNPKQQPQPQQQQNNRQSHHQQQQPPSKSSQDFWGPAVGAGGSEVKAPSWRQQPKQQQRPDMLASLQATSGQPDKQQPAAAAAAGEEGAASAKDSGATVARPAAVTYPKFLLPTSEHEHREFQQYCSAEQALAKLFALTVVCCVHACCGNFCGNYLCLACVMASDKTKRKVASTFV